MATTTRMTADELMRLPDDGWRDELIDGELHRTAPAGFEHGIIGLRFGRFLGAFVDEHDLGVVTAAETGFYVSHDPLTILAPDAAFYRADRLPPPDQRQGFANVIPDLVVEVVSPSDAPGEVEDKVARYLAAGVPLVWVAYPRRRAVRAHRPGREPLNYPDGTILDGGAVLPGFRLPVSDLFG